MGPLGGLCVDGGSQSPPGKWGSNPDLEKHGLGAFASEPVLWEVAVQGHQCSRCALVREHCQVQLVSHQPGPWHTPHPQEG